MPGADPDIDRDLCSREMEQAFEQLPEPGTSPITDRAPLDR